MKNILPAAVVALSILAAAACERKTVVIEVPPATPVAEPVAKTRTLETSRLGEAIDTFERSATPANSAEVKKAFAKLDGEIAEPEEYVTKHEGDDRAKAAGKLKNMQEYRAGETARFAAAQAKAPLTRSAPADTRSGADKIEDSARKAGNAIEDGAKEARDRIKDAVR